jgi:hypothetical protein
MINEHRPYGVCDKRLVNHQDDRGIHISDNGPASIGREV